MLVVDSRGAAGLAWMDWIGLKVEIFFRSPIYLYIHLSIYLPTRRIRRMHSMCRRCSKTHILAAGADEGQTWWDCGRLYERCKLKLQIP